MTYCHISREIDRYLDNEFDLEGWDEAYLESDQYQENLAEFQEDYPGATEQDFQNSPVFWSGVERFAGL